MSEEEKLEIKQHKKEDIKIKNEPPKLPLLEEIGNAITHGIGALLAIAALVLMLVKADSAGEYVSASVYGSCGIIMLLMSCLYHSFKSGSTVKRVFRRFDYSSIYLLIGGTFAPLLLVYVGGTTGLVLFIIQWILILIGITFVAIFGAGRFKWLHFPLYFVLGWSGLILVPSMIHNCIGLFWWILIGGLVYTIGMVPFCIRGKQATHFIWHFFVLGGAIIQWFGIYFYVF